MKRKSMVLAGVVAAALSAASVVAGPGKGAGGPGAGMSPGAGAGGPAVSAEETGAGAQPQLQHRHRVGEKDTGKKVRAEGAKAGAGETSVAPMEVAPAE